MRSTLRRLSPSLILTLAVATIPAAAGAAVLNPSVTIDETMSNAPQNSSVNLLDLGNAAGTNGLVTSDTLTFGGGNSIVFSGKSGVYQGNAKGVTAAPFTVSGQQTNNYFAAQPSGSVMFQYTSAQKYFGLLWGSVDGYNTLSFYSGNTLVQQVGGSQISANANGNQTASGSYYVNFNFGGSTSYDRVVMTSSNPAFEFDAITYSQTNIPITSTPTGDGPTRVVAQDPTNPDVLNAPLHCPGSTPSGVIATAATFALLMRRRMMRSR